MSHDLTPAGAHAALDDTPRMLDTYALVYALTLVFFMPGVMSIVNLPYREYTFAYVSLVTAPFLLGLFATLLTDSRDSLKTRAIRAAILTPLIVLTGVTVLFTSALITVPIGRVLRPQHFDIEGPVALAMLVLVALPLAPALFRRFRSPLGWRSVVQILALLFALAIVIGVAVLTLRPDRLLGTIQRKDIVIYVVGALTWYLPAFGIAAGAWRKVGLV